MRLSIFAALALAIAAPANAQSVKSEVPASNGVVITKYADDFAGRYEYSAPSVDFALAQGTGKGFALVARTRRSGALGDLNVQGAIIYHGEWQYFTGAVFKGGDPVDYTKTGSDVGSCRYGCSLTESFTIKISPEQIKKHAENGVIPIQIRAAKTGNTGLLQIPVSYFDAVNEVAK